MKPPQQFNSVVVVVFVCACLLLLWPFACCSLHFMHAVHAQVPKHCDSGNTCSPAWLHASEGARVVQESTVSTRCAGSPEALMKGEAGYSCRCVGRTLRKLTFKKRVVLGRGSVNVLCIVGL